MLPCYLFFPFTHTTVTCLAPVNWRVTSLGLNLLAQEPTPPARRLPLSNGRSFLKGICGQGRKCSRKCSSWHESSFISQAMRPCGAPIGKGHIVEVHRAVECCDGAEEDIPWVPRQVRTGGVDAPAPRKFPLPQQPFPLLFHAHLPQPAFPNPNFTSSNKLDVALFIPLALSGIPMARDGSGGSREGQVAHESVSHQKHKTHIF